MAISYWETQHQTYLNLFSSSGRNIITYNTEHFLKCTFTWFMAGIKISFTSNNLLHSLSPNSNIIFVLSLCCFRMPLKNKTLCYCEWSCIFHGKAFLVKCWHVSRWSAACAFLLFSTATVPLLVVLGTSKTDLVNALYLFVFVLFCFFEFPLILLI